MESPLRIGIAGLGTVGVGTLQILQQHAGDIAQRTGRHVQVVAVSMRDISKDRGVDLSGIRIVADARDLAAADDIDVVVELIGGEEGIARELVEAALRNKKHVVTANKALMAHHGQELAHLAETQHRLLAFEAAVAGGIPIIAGLRVGLAANNITRVAGILNGTCNYILTTMEKSGRDFDEVFAEASALGYVEADPSLDIDGIDAAHKIAILASLAFGTQIHFAGVKAEGIRAITLRDMRYAAEFGYRIKQLGVASYDGQRVYQAVRPLLIPLSSPLASVDGSFNAVQVNADFAGGSMFVGRGAGAGPTGSAVVSDIMAIARGDRYSPFTLPAGQLKPVANAATSDGARAFYLRLSVKDAPGVLAEITRIFAHENISVRAITQRECMPDGAAQVVVITHATESDAMQRAVAAIGKLAVCVAAPVCLGIEQ
jgi:homoserine dehydrogenase